MSCPIKNGEMTASSVTGLVELVDESIEYVEGIGRMTASVRRVLHIVDIDEVEATIAVGIIRNGSIG